MKSEELFSNKLIPVYRSIPHCSKQVIFFKFYHRIKKAKNNIQIFILIFKSTTCQILYLLWKEIRNLGFHSSDFYFHHFSPNKVHYLYHKCSKSHYNPQVPENRHFVILYRKCKVFKKVQTNSWNSPTNLYYNL